MRRLKIYSLVLPLLAFVLAACSSPKNQEKQEVDSGSIIIGHVTDSHSWHILDYTSKDGKEHSVAVNLPIILITREIERNKNIIPNATPQKPPSSKRINAKISPIGISAQSHI